MPDKPFWETVTLRDMTDQQWESLCDGCGKCCVLKLEDIDTNAIYYTDVSCQLLCTKSAQCTDYANRKQLVPDCVILTPDNLDAVHWMPESCAYRRLHEGDPLPDWHPLLTGNKQAMIAAHHCVANHVTSETEIAEDDMPDHLYDWDHLTADVKIIGGERE